ncbi:MAG: imelysin family protein [Chloroflexota bacterium]|nr:imelysin family protein [Chloroflexota bacterium]
MATRLSARSVRRAALLPPLILGAALLLAACSSDVTRRDVAASLTELVIVPRYEAAADRAEAMSEGIRTLVSEPTPARLHEARDSWRDARSAWSRVQAYTLGPVMELRIPSLVSWWPIDESKIRDALARPSISAEDVRDTFAADQRGFGALELLLFADGDSVLSHLQADDEAYSQYLMALAEVIADAVRQASNDWSGEYGEAFSGSGDRAISENLAIADLVRVPVFLTETLGDMQLGVALGITKPEADLNVIPEGVAATGVEDLDQSMRGIQDTYLGDADGLGLSDLVAELSTEADQRMRDALLNAITAIESLRETGKPLKDLLQTDSGLVIEARDAIKNVQLVLNTEVVSLLGITIGFSDNDGDS